MSLKTLLLAAAVLVAPAEIDVTPWYGRSIYFIVVDRFAKDFSDTDPQCGLVDDGTAKSWCGGTIKGIIRKLDYIKEMGFDAIWITPIVKQTDWTDNYNGTAYHGYWAQDFNDIDPHFGTKDDVKRLSAECKKRGMLYMQDIVANHVGPLHDLTQVSRLAAPLNDPSGRQFNTYGIQPGMSFEDYLKMPPREAYVNIPDPYTGKIKYSCWTGNYSCFPEYSEEIIEKGWFGDLGDLNHWNETVAEYLLDWIARMQKDYDIDGFRLDTAGYIPQSFLSRFQQAAGVYMIGEVVTYNISYHQSYQHHLLGMLNFPIALQWTPFPENEMSNDVWNSVGSFNKFNELMDLQLKSNYTDFDLLGNFIDNHDTTRFAYSHKNDQIALENALTFVFMMPGLPILYYGTENPGVSAHLEERRSMWMTMPQFGRGDPEPFEKTRLFYFIQRLNGIRKLWGLGHGGDAVHHPLKVVLASKHIYAFARGNLLVMVTDGGSGTTAPTCIDRQDLPSRLDAGCDSEGIHDVLGGTNYRKGAVAECFPLRVCVQLDGSHPAILAARDDRPSQVGFMVAALFGDEFPEGRNSLIALGVGSFGVAATILSFWAHNKYSNSDHEGFLLTH